MRNKTKRSPRRGTARAAHDGSSQLPHNNSSAGGAEQHHSYTDDFPLRVLLIARRGDEALVVVNGLTMVWAVDGLNWLHANGSEAVLQ